MSRPLNVLFLCTHNSARSILAEALLNQLGAGKFKAFSAGSSPRDNQRPNPLAIKALARAGIDASHYTSKSWDVFADSGAPQMDLIITVCDNAAGETCPVWPGHPATAHWSYADPSETPGDETTKEAAFWSTLLEIKRRLELFTALPVEKLLPHTLQSSARELAA
jgi:arsenate reductase (thioredoxin)